MGRSERDLGRRERQIMDAIYRLGEASVGQVLEQLPDPPSYSAVRTMVRYLETKGFLRHRKEGTKYVYRPTRSREAASRSALKHLLNTFFGGSVSDAVAAILDAEADRLSDDELKRIRKLIDQARREGR